MIQFIKGHTVYSIRGPILESDSFDIQHLDVAAGFKFSHSRVDTQSWAHDTGNRLLILVGDISQSSNWQTPIGDLTKSISFRSSYLSQRKTSSAAHW